MKKPERMKSFRESEEDGSFEGLESSVNDWLAANPNIEIVGRQAVGSTFVCETGLVLTVCTIFIFYHQK